MRAVGPDCATFYAISQCLVVVVAVTELEVLSHLVARHLSPEADF